MASYSLRQLCPIVPEYPLVCQDYPARISGHHGSKAALVIRLLCHSPEHPASFRLLQVYCIMEMEMPGCLLPWNSKLTTDAEAAAGWTFEQLDRMADDKLKYINKARKEVRSHYQW